MKRVFKDKQKIQEIKVKCKKCGAMITKSWLNRHKCRGGY